MLGSMVFIFAVAAIIFERAINDLLLSYMNPWSVLGLALLILGIAPILATSNFLNMYCWAVVFIGAGLLVIGVILGGAASVEAATAVQTHTDSLSVFTQKLPCGG